MVRFTSEWPHTGGLAVAYAVEFCAPCIEAAHLRASAPIAAAWSQVEEWLSCPVVWIPHPTERHRDILGSLFSDTLGRSNLVPDAHLAALAIEHGLILCSTDRDFAHFPNLRWNDPLQHRKS